MVQYSSWGGKKKISNYHLLSILEKPLYKCDWIRYNVSTWCFLSDRISYVGEKNALCAHHIKPASCLFQHFQSWEARLLVCPTGILWVAHTPEDKDSSYKYYTDAHIHNGPTNTTTHTKRHVLYTHLDFSQDRFSYTWLPTYLRCTTWNLCIITILYLINVQRLLTILLYIPFFKLVLLNELIRDDFPTLGTPITIRQ